MKKVTKILSVVLVLALVLAMSVVLFACNKPNNTSTQLDAVDKAIDSTINSYFEALSNNYELRTMVKDSSFWQDMSIIAYKENVKSDYTFKVSSALETELNSPIVIDPVNNYGPAPDYLPIPVPGTEQQAQYGKYYYALKANGKNLDAFATKYEQHINKYVKDDYFFNAYETPFLMTYAKNINKGMDKINAVMNKTDFVTTMPSDGSNGALWTNICLSAFKDYKDIDFSAFTNIVKYEEIDFDNFYDPTVPYHESFVSDGVALNMFAALGINIREVQKDKESDIVEHLVSMIDPKTNLILIDKNKELTANENANVSQIYAGLLAYKIQRDTGKAFNIFAV